MINDSNPFLDLPDNSMIGRSPGLEWRYSFSQAELIMCKELPKAAKTAFVGFKAMVKKYINMSESKRKRGRKGQREVKIRSYAMKCILLHYVEEKEKDFWTGDEDELVEKVYR